jgi:exosortase E/protease (VPEID-CTERM system)
MHATTESSSIAPIGVWRYRPQLALMGLLLAEVLYLTISFDTQPLEKAPSIWTVLVGLSPQYLRLAIAIAVVTLLPHGKWLTAATPVSGVGGGSTQSRLPFLVFHAFAFLLFARLTGIFFVAGNSVVSHPALWSAAWCVTGAATFASWALAVYPHERWRAAIIERRVLIAWGVAAGTVVWAAGFLAEALWPPLARYTFAIVRWVLSSLYADVISDPDALRVGTPAFRVVIAPECSGYEGVGLILAFLAIYLFLFRKDLRFPGALLLLPLGAITIWILNAVRIIALVVIGTSGWRDIAAGGFHSQAGWLLFNAVGLSFVAIINRGGYFMAHAKAACEVADSPTFQSTAAYLGPFVAMLAAAMLTGAVSAGFDWLYALRIVAIAAVIWSCRKTYARLNWTCSWGALAIGVATFAVWVAMFPDGLTSKAVWPVALQSVPSSWAAAWLALRLGGYVIAVPVAEELAFRVYAMRRVMDSDIERVPVGAFSWPSFVISSALFGAFHGALWPQGVIAGMAFACALCRRRAVGDAVLAHATTNALIAMYVFATGRWSVWS